MKRLFLSILLCVFVWGMKAQEMDAVFVAMPDQYKIEDITAIERPDGLFYDFELKQDNNEIHIILDSEAKIVIKSSTIAPGYDW